MENEDYDCEPLDDLVVKPINNKKQFQNVQKDVAKMKNNEAARKYRQKKKEHQDKMI